MGPRELGAAARVLGRAFRDNPLNVTVIGGDAERRQRCNTAGTLAFLPLARSRGQVWAAREAGRVSAALVGVPSSAYPLPSPAAWDQLRLLAVQGFGVARRWAQVFAELAGLHPAQPHDYLAVLGVAPERQGRGLGAALLRGWLEREAAERCVYLETDRRANLAFYERAGFRLLSELTVLEVPVWRMERPALPAG